MLRLALGLDVGTSGVRALVLADRKLVASSHVAMPGAERDGTRIAQKPEIWWSAVTSVLAEIGRQVPLKRVAALAVDGTSGTIMPIDRGGRPLAKASMYNDGSAAEASRRIAQVAPPETAAHGATSPLGRALSFKHLPGLHAVVHQADWIAGLISGQHGVTDENNALKTGYDPILRRWPDWIDAVGFDRVKLPRVVAAGSVIGLVSEEACDRFGFLPDAVVVAGTTDGCAAFLATGADRPGDGVTSLGSTLVLKLLSDRPIFAPQFGIYSHRIGDVWLAGGASNTGGAVLLKYFDAERIAALTPELRPDQPTGLDYYPLATAGERFPVADASHAPRLEPRPDNEAMFLQGMLEGIANVEARGFAKLADLGGPRLKRLFTVGGGAKNVAWRSIRKRTIGADFVTPLSEDAAFGTALLAARAIEGAA